MQVQCELCPRLCVIAPGQSGECRVRVNVDGRLTAVTYGFPCSVHVDPVEKKPVFHFLPGTTTFSLATVGCNLHCKNCQNWEISQQDPEQVQASPLPPDEVTRLALRYGCRSVSCTYTDPVVFYEYTLDSCIRAREAGLRTVLVTAGYIQPAPFKELLGHLDAVRIDLKALSEAFYREVCEATLAPVLNALTLARRHALLLEVVHLIIPTLNDRDEDLTRLCRWVRDNLGRETPLHFSRFYPQYRMSHLPPTSAETLLRAREIARAEGLTYVYLGNILLPDAANTYCPGCGELLVERIGFNVVKNRLARGGCPRCHKEIYGIWS